MKITQALADVKLTKNKINSKQMTIQKYSVRTSNMVDPMAKEGGSAEFVKRELQAIRDLNTHIVILRRKINNTNMQAQFTIHGETKSVFDWLTWRREVGNSYRSFLAALHNIPEKAQTTLASKANPEGVELVNNLDEVSLIKELEHVKTILDTLDGELSLFNAITDILE